MANKNTKRFRVAVARACRAGEAVCLYQEASGRGDVNYTRRAPTARRGAGGVVSTAPKRNMQMVVLQNSDGSGKVSATVHEPIDRDRYIRHKNHGYEHWPKYTQTMQTSSRPAVN